LDLLKAIKGRRTVRKFRPDDIESEPVRVMIDAARWAPSAANRQPWEFIVISREETRKRIAGLYVQAYLKEAEELPKSKYADELYVEDLEKLKEKIYRIKDKLRAQLEIPPVHIIVCADPTKSKSYIVDTAAAIQNMLLAAHSLNLGTAWIDISSTLLGEFFDKQALKDLLDIPEEIEVMAIIPVGYPDEKPPRPPRRLIREIAHREKYQIV
jgi:nitroreductase